MREINKLRAQINGVDERLRALLNRRARLARQVRRIKKDKKLAGYDPVREEEIIQRVVGRNPGPLDQRALEAIYREIVSACRRLGGELKIVYLGPEATFTHEAALQKFGASASFSPAESIGTVFKEVELGNADYGVVPIENSLEGAVTYTLDMFIDSELKICSEIFLRVSHSLISRYPLNRLKKVYSHPQVFGQCRRWLQQHLPQAELVEAASTAQAARQAASEKECAALASPLAASVYGLKVLADRVEDSSMNITRFLVIGRTSPPARGKSRTSILFSLPHRAGSLHDALAPFKRRGINLTKIESRPSKKKAWEYYFFADLDGHCQNRKVKAALEELSRLCFFLKVLGSYPCSRG